MGKIRALNEHLTNMIAAGEVVERGRGIVKELVENSIDAQAQHITIEMQQGGIESLCVRDDGEGMDEEDCAFAFERHATSKIRESDDLLKIHTMGFRGEALPSIGAVAKVTLKSMQENTGSEVVVSFGKMEKKQACGMPKGTSVLVEQLFQKTPARFKYLKSPQYEASLIIDVVQKFAMGYPNIAFRLVSNGKEIFKTRGSGNLQEVALAIYGREVVEDVIDCKGSDSDFELAGIAMQPQHQRASTYYTHIFINRRMVREHRLQKAVFDAFAPYMAKQRYPMTILHVFMDPQLVDVNVHPSKWEIRLSKSKQLEKLIFETVKKALEKQHQIFQTKSTTIEQEEISALDFMYAGDEDEKKLRKEVNDSFVHPETYQVEGVKSETLFAQKNSAEKLEQAKRPAFPDLEVIGQFHNSYIIAQGELGLYIIDQHAAQERYHYEVIARAIKESKADIQTLLLPITIEVPSQVLEMIDRINLALGDIQIQVEVFGENTLLVREVPTWMETLNEVDFIREMIDVCLRDEDKSKEAFREQAIASMACHSSLKFHHALGMDEMKQVIVDLKKCEQPFHCPHGRPTLITIKEKDLIKDFERG